MRRMLHVVLLAVILTIATAWEDRIIEAQGPPCLASTTSGDGARSGSGWILCLPRHSFRGPAGGRSSVEGTTNTGTLACMVDCSPGPCLPRARSSMLPTACCKGSKTV